MNLEPQTSKAPSGVWGEKTNAKRCKYYRQKTLAKRRFQLRSSVIFVEKISIIRKLQSSEMYSKNFIDKFHFIADLKSSFRHLFR